MLGNGPVRFGGRPRGKGPNHGHLAARPTQWHHAFIVITIITAAATATAVTGRRANVGWRGFRQSSGEGDGPAS